MKKLTMMGALALLAGALAPGAAAQINGRIDGTAYDLEGKPWPDVTVVIHNNDSNQSYTVKTDKKGQYLQIGLASGVYLLTFKKEAYTCEKQFRLGAGDQHTEDVNFKQCIAQNPGYAEAVKKQQEEKQKFDTMKGHFNTGRAALDQAEQIGSQLPKTPADQRGALQQQIAQLSQTAITELQQAQQAAGEKEPNLHLIMANLGRAYESAGKYDEAAAAFQKAAELKPQANYYVALGTDLARAGKMDDAGTACGKAATPEATNAGACWRNVGIVLVNAGKMKEAVDPLHKATEADPKNPEGWYWLGSSLLNAMDFKQEGDKIVPVVKPGTAEAFQKYLELAPNGPRAADAKVALEQLAALGQGVQTTVKTRKKK